MVLFILLLLKPDEDVFVLELEHTLFGLCFYLQVVKAQMYLLFLLLHLIDLLNLIKKLHILLLYLNLQLLINLIKERPFFP